MSLETFEYLKHESQTNSCLTWKSTWAGGWSLGATDAFADDPEDEMVEDVNAEEVPPGVPIDGEL
jgi:predicted porin